MLLRRHVSYTGRVAIAYIGEVQHACQHIVLQVVHSKDMCQVQGTCERGQACRRKKEHCHATGHCSRVTSRS